MKTPTTRPESRGAASRRLAFALLTLGASSVFGQATWTGAVDSDWNNASNWSSAPSAPSGNFTVNTSTGNFPTLGTNAAFTPVDIFIGNGASGRLDHSAGQLSSGAGNWSFVGNGAGGTGVYNMSGSSSFTSGRLIIGQAGGTGTVTLNTSGTLTGNAAGGDWWAQSAIAIGVDAGSTGTVNLQAGTITTSGSNRNIWVGAFGGNGTLNQTGGVINTDGLSLGRYLGTGSMTVTNGTVNAGYVNLSHAGNAGDTSVGTLSVNSGGVVNSEGDFTVGFAGSAASQGTLNVNAGGVVNVATTTERWMVVNQWDTMKGVMNVNGGTINLNANADLRFSTGNGTGASVVNLNSGAITSWSGNQTGTTTTGVLDLNQAGGASANNTFNLNGGALTINQVITNNNSGTATFNFNGGTLKAAGDSSNFVDLGGAGQTAVVMAGGAVIDSNGFNVTIPQALVAGIGGGGLTKDGAGTLTLTGANTFTGDISINAGTLAITSAFIDDAADVNLVTGAVFDLGFVGSDTIGSLFINGVSQAVGTYGGVGSGATFESAYFSGTGLLNVTVSAIPEPASFAALGGLAALVFGVMRRRRR